MAERSKLMTRMAATLAGEVSGETLEAYQQAGSGVYDLLVECEQRRAAMADDGQALWKGEDGAGELFLAAWNAYVLQSLGDAFLEADYKANPRTVGYVPRVTAEQAMNFYGQVERWLGRARAAQAGARPGLDAVLPAPLPPWVDVEPCPNEHLEAMQHACASMREHAELAVADLSRAAPESRREQLDEIRRSLAEVTSAADYAAELHHGRSSRELHERVENTIKRAIEGAYRVGQLASMPELIGAGVRAGGRSLPLPGQPGFDPWVLTDPDSRERWKRDPQARAAVDLVWRSDPSPATTMATQAEIDAAIERGDVRYATGPGGRIGHYYCCPWSAIYEAVRPVEIAGRPLAAGQQFTFDVSAEEMFEGGRFKRELVAGNFGRTSEVDYCDPRG